MNLSDFQAGDYIRFLHKKNKPRRLRSFDTELERGGTLTDKPFRQQRLLSPERIMVVNERFIIIYKKRKQINKQAFCVIDKIKKQIFKVEGGLKHDLSDVIQATYFLNGIVNKSIKLSKIKRKIQELDMDSAPDHPRKSVYKWRKHIIKTRII